MALDLVSVAWNGLAARKVRTALVIVGPMLGVAAIVGILGLTASAKGDVRAALSELGTNLILVDPAVAPGSETRLPDDAAQRVARVSTVTEVAQSSVVSDIKVAASYEAEGALTLATLFEVWAAGLNLFETLDLDMASGRFLNRFDDEFASRGVVLGADVASFFGVVPGSARSILIDGEPYGVVGVLEPSSLLRRLNNAVLVTYGTAAARLANDGAPGTLYVRAVPGATEATGAAIPTAINYGGPGFVFTRFPTDLLEAEAKVDATFRAIVLVLGALSLFVGGVGIANVMTISVLQRASEIGIRRALGNTRGIIAAQFLLESLAIGALGGLLGVLAGTMFVVAAADYQGWVLELDFPAFAAVGTLAVVVAVIAGIYPAIRAASLEPLETLRLG